MDAGNSPNAKPGQGQTEVRVCRRAYTGTERPGARAAGEVHVWEWCFGDGDLTAADETALRRDLTPEENGRATRYRNPSARGQFLRSRAALRRLLGGYLGEPPLTVAIVPNADGKPMLAGRELQFNVSHTDGVLIFAVADVAVGVDVERLRPMPSAAGLVERYFSPEERRQFSTLPEALRALGFFRGWTCKEAVLKGIGCGVRELDRCVVELHPEGPPAILGPETTAAAWRLVTWHPTAGTVAAIAIHTKSPVT